jgi:hypothetical protein
MCRAASLLALLVLAATTNAAERSLSVTAADGFLPPMKAIVVVKAGAPGPGAAKFQAVAQTSKYKDAVKLPADGPYDVWWQPKDGLPVRAVSGVTVKEGETKEVRLEQVLGVVSVRGDNLPRAALVMVAPQDDPGPDDKGHAPVQTARDYRVEMVVPEGFYSLWVTPDNGTRPKKVNDRFKVQAGKSVVLD